MQQSLRENRVEMLPGPSVYDVVDRLPCHAESLGKAQGIFAFGKGGADIVDGFLRELGVRSPFSAHGSTLEHLVFSVVSLSSQEQVVRSNACRNVAGMANAKTPWDFSEGKNVGCPVGLDDFAVHGCLPVALNEGPKPEPTSIGFLYARPERIRPFAAFAVVLDKPVRSAPNMPIASSRYRGDGGSLSASTFAEVVREFHGCPPLAPKGRQRVGPVGSWFFGSDPRRAKSESTTDELLWSSPQVMPSAD